MSVRWSGEQVLALAPDGSSVAAARALAVPGRWRATGACDAPAVIWGECPGSGKSPYRTAVDLAGPAFSCTCPSRKFPCKHALAVLLLWSAGAVPDAAEPVDWAAGWLAGRQERAARTAARAARGSDDAATGPTATDGPADPEAARRRAEQRRRRMTDGLAELDQWLCDQVRSGLAGTDRAGYQPFDPLAARMVDAQLPAVANTVRRLAAVAVSGEGWPGRLLQEYALLHLLARSAPAALADPGSDLTATVRARLGVTVAKDDVLAAPAVRDEWAVLGHRDDVEDRLTVRQVWLRGTSTGRPAVVLSFAVSGQILDASLVPGTVVDADLHFYPGALPLRALVGVRHAPAEPASRGVPGVGLEAALAAWAAALAADPWVRSWPVVLAGVVPVVDDARWWLVDGEASLPVVDPGEAAWGLLAASGGHPITVLAEIVPGGTRCVTALRAAS
jgi:hypothetical protein